MALFARFLRVQFSFDRFILWHFIVSARAHESSSGFNYTLATRGKETKERSKKRKKRERHKDCSFDPGEPEKKERTSGAEPENYQMELIILS